MSSHYSTMTADERTELDIVFAAEAEAQVAVKHSAAPAPAPVTRQPRPRFLFTLPYMNHSVCVSSAQAREFCGKTLGSMIVFIETNPNETRTIGDSDVYAAMDHLVDRLNEQTDLVSEWTGTDHLQIDDIEFCSLPDGYAVSVTYSNDPAYEVLGQMRREKQRKGQRVPVSEF